VLLPAINRFFYDIRHVGSRVTACTSETIDNIWVRNQVSAKISLSGTCFTIVD